MRRTLAGRRKESVHRRRKGDRKVSRRVFASLGQTLDGEDYSGEAEVQLNNAGRLVIDSWVSLSRYEALCLALGDGVAQHAQSPQSVIREIFTVHAPRAKLTKAEKQVRSKARK